MMPPPQAGCAAPSIPYIAPVTAGWKTSGLAGLAQSVVLDIVGGAGWGAAPAGTTTGGGGGGGGMDAVGGLGAAAGLAAAADTRSLYARLAGAAHAMCRVPASRG